MAIKQRRLAPGREFNAAEGVLVYAAEAITEDYLVVATDMNGGLMSVVHADAADEAKSVGQLWIAKHDIPAGGKGIVLPWKKVGNLIGGTAGDPIYLGLAGAWAESVDSTTKILRQVGTFIDSDTAVIAPNIDHGQHIRAEAATGSGTQPILFELTVAAGAATSITLDRAIRVVDCWLRVTTDHATGENFVVSSTGDTISTVATGNSPGVGKIVRATSIDATYMDIASGGVLRANLDGANIAGVAYVLAYLRG